LSFLINLGFGFHVFFRRIQRFDLIGDLFDHIHELGGFSRGNPGKLDPAGLNPRVFQKVFQKGEFSSGVVITFQVMAFAGMSPGHPDGIRALSEAGQNKFGAHAAGAGDPDDPDIGRIFHPADAGQVGGAIAAPVAQKT
jgi:hypothetical protein